MTTQRSCCVDRDDVIPCAIGNFCPNRCSLESYKELPKLLHVKEGVVGEYLLVETRLQVPLVTKAGT